MPTHTARMQTQSSNNHNLKDHSTRPYIINLFPHIGWKRLRDSSVNPFQKGVQGGLEGTEGGIDLLGKSLPTPSNPLQTKEALTGQLPLLMTNYKWKFLTIKGAQHTYTTRTATAIMPSLHVYGTSVHCHEGIRNSQKRISRDILGKW